jgi:hypothetical protein
MKKYFYWKIKKTDIIQQYTSMVEAVNHLQYPIAQSEKQLNLHYTNNNYFYYLNYSQ